MISLWWSFALTAIGVTGLVLVYRSQSLAGPRIGLAVQLLWVAYAIATRQWWFIVSAAAYGAANIYGIRTRSAAAHLERFAAMRCSTCGVRWGEHPDGRCCTGCSCVGFTPGGES